MLISVQKKAIFFILLNDVWSNEMSSLITEEYFTEYFYLFETSVCLFKLNCAHLEL